MTTTQSYRTKRKARDIPPTEHAVDGFTWDQIKEMASDSVVTARCIYCEAEADVEPDARKYDCRICGGAETVTSPLVKLGLI